MKYYSFKKMYFPKDLGGTLVAAETIETDKDMKILILIQGAIDKVFNHFKQESNKTKPLPFWLLDSYNDYIKIIEDDKYTLIEKHQNSLKVAESLFINVFINLGERKAKELFIETI